MILVVGGAGYIGSHMCKVLRENGEEHLVFDNLEEGHREALQSSPLVVGDLRESEDLAKLFDSYPIDTVMHFAAYIAVGESVKNPSKYYRNNVSGVLHLLDAMKQAKVNRFIFSSTAAIFGEPQYVPIDEEHPKAPTSPYGDGKWAVERMLQAFDTAYGLRSVCLRYFNAAGADPDGVLGEDHRPETHLIPAVLLAALGQVPEVKVFGTDYDTPDGTCIRDYIHVVDLAQAHLLAVRHLREGGASAQFNLGNGTGYSVKQVIDTVERVVGKPIPKTETPRRQGDPARLVASSDKARAVLGWSPKYPALDDIVQHAWIWRKANPNGYSG